MARVCKFYGYTPQEYYDLDIVDLFVLKDSIKRLESQDFIEKLGLSRAQNLSTKDYRKLHEDHMRIAYPVEPMEVEEISDVALAEILSGRVNG